MLQECHVPEAGIRGRKKSEVAEAGAQEDGTHAIEDVSDYFDWRLSAAKAIFYLGDEALEGGGEKDAIDSLAVVLKKNHLWQSYAQNSIY